MPFSDFNRSLRWTRSWLNRPATRALSGLVELLSPHSGDIDNNDRIMLAVTRVLLLRRNEIHSSARSAFESILSKNYSDEQVERYLTLLDTVDPVPAEKVYAMLSDMSSERQKWLLELWLALAHASGEYSREKAIYLQELAQGCAPEVEVLFPELEKKAQKNYQHRQSLVKSGAGLAVALIVILVFILTATYLKSVLFGLLLAYICLPLEKWFERKLDDPHSIPGYVFKTPDKVTSRLRNLAGKLRPAPVSHSAEEMAEKLRRSRIARASTLTVVTVLCSFLLFLAICFMLSVHYVSNLRESVQEWHNAPTVTVQKESQPSDNPGAAEPDKSEPAIQYPAEDTVPEGVSFPDTINNLTHQANKTLDYLKNRFQNIPLVNWGIEELAKFLRDPETQQEFLRTLFAKSGGVLFFLGSLIGKAAAIALDILLTIFFFSLLLNQLALFANNSSLKSRSEYLVRSVFNGKWLPGATEESLAEGERIISEIIRKLQNWVRGYCLLIIIDFIVYTTVFLLLKVPYAPILGFIAASALLLPYIGPIASALLTLLVTFAVCGSDVTGLQMAGIIGIYLLENGIVEQFFLYPAVIGESLGLTTLETIIVVLLGGYFAGITGMIFAMPTAAVLKYLIPQIYNCWR